MGAIADKGCVGVSERWEYDAMDAKLTLRKGEGNGRWKEDKQTQDALVRVLIGGGVGISGHVIVNEKSPNTTWNSQILIDFK